MLIGAPSTQKWYHWYLTWRFNRQALYPCILVSCVSSYRLILFWKNLLVALTLFSAPPPTRRRVQEAGLDLRNICSTSIVSRLGDRKYTTLPYRKQATMLHGMVIHGRAEEWSIRQINTGTFRKTEISETATLCSSSSTISSHGMRFKEFLSVSGLLGDFLGQ